MVPSRRELSSSQIVHRDYSEIALIILIYSHHTLRAKGFILPEITDLTYMFGHRLTVWLQTFFSLAYSM